MTFTEWAANLDRDLPPGAPRYYLQIARLRRDAALRLGDLDFARDAARALGWAADGPPDGGQ